MDVIDLHHWDRSPHRELLSYLLMGPSSVQGDHLIEEDLHELQRADLVSFRLLEERDLDDMSPDSIDPGRPAWLAELTPSGTILGLRLVHTMELLRILATCGRVCRHGASWHGVGPSQLLRELDLRAGGNGEVHDLDPGTWLAGRDIDQIQRLPRRGGLDPSQEPLHVGQG